jgi:hypothetical protein
VKSPTIHSTPNYDQFTVGLLISPTSISFLGLIFFDVISGVIFGIIAVTIIFKDKMWLILPENSEAIYNETKTSLKAGKKRN